MESKRAWNLVRLKGRLIKAFKPAWGENYKHKIGAAFLTAFLSWMGVCFLRTLPGYGFLEAKAYDLRMIDLASREKPSGQVVLVMIDDASLKFFEDQDIFWPWPRSLYVPVLHYLKKGNAKAVVFDLTFSGEDPGMFLGASDEFANAMRQTVPCTLPLKLRGKKFKKQSSSYSLRSTLDIRKTSHDIVYRGIELPIPVLAQSAAALGNVITLPDEDGIYRRIKPFYLYEEDEKKEWIPTLALSALAQVLDVKKIAWSDAGVEIDGRSLPTDPNGNVLLRYRASTAPIILYDHYSIASLIQSYQQMEAGEAPQLSPEIFSGKYVIVGTSAPELYDLRATPISNISLGCVVHATLLDNLLQGDPMRTLSFWDNVLLLLSIALSMALVLTFFSNLWTEAILSLLAGTFFHQVNYIIFRQGLYIELIGGISVVVLVFFGTTLSQYFIEGRQRSFLKKAFSHYISPILVEQIIKEPQRLRLGGERKIITVFFSDLAGFTTLSESREPEELVMFLSEYLQEMTQIILNYDGTVDKYEGDAIMSFWGAPITQQDHAVRACMAALENQKRMVTLREEFQKRGFPPIKVRIGLNSGPALVGNMGCSGRFDYTAIGNTVNLASRLEGANKIFDTGIMIGEMTYELAKHAIAARMLGKIQVKGKNIPETVYQPLATQDSVSLVQKMLIHEFDQALSLYYERKFTQAKDAFKQIYLSFKEDGPSYTYLYYCDKCMQNPPESNWQGVIKLDSK